MRNAPQTFNVSLYKGYNAKNPNAPYGSKGIGEPPHSLGYASITYDLLPDTIITSFT
jgi:xanthine dehydrogenase molybdopterin-binding subunit B